MTRYRPTPAFALALATLGLALAAAACLVGCGGGGDEAPEDEPLRCSAPTTLPPGTKSIPACFTPRP